MRPELHAWNSPSTGASMPLRRIGRTGTPLLYVPTSGGDEREFERYGMHEDCAAWIAAGRVQLFSIDGRGPQTLFHPSIAPRERIARYVAFERYVKSELLPWLADTTGSPTLDVVGASYGAFVAANLLFKEFARVRRACGLGGVYEMWHRLEGYHDDDVYYHTPVEYLPRLEDPAILAGIRATGGLALFAAADDEWLGETVQLARVLQDKALPHRTEVWPSPADHHERWWKPQLRRFSPHDLRRAMTGRGAST